MENNESFDVKKCSIGAAVLYAIDKNKIEVWQDVLSRTDFPKDILIELLVKLGNGKLLRSIFKESGLELIALMKESKIELDSLLDIFAYLYPNNDELWQLALDIPRVYKYFCELSETVLFEKYPKVTSGVFVKQMYLMHPVL